MSAHFSFEVDRPRNLVRIVMAGLFREDDVAAFLSARTEAHAKLYCGPNQHVTLNDVRDLKIQPQETVAAFREMLADPAYRSRRLAFVTASTLAAGQLMRALDGRPGQRFDDPEAALTWLLEPDEIETAPPARRIGRFGQI